MSAASFQLMWGPGLIGLMFGLALYGIEISQVVFYMQAFPCDKLQLKVLVLALFVFDSTLTSELVWFQHHMLIECRSSTSPNCVSDVPPFTTFGTGVVFWITFAVQSFYAHRVWIISGKNRAITSAVVLSTLIQLVLGSVVTVSLIFTPTYQFMFTTKALPLSAAASTVCDAIITVSIIYYLRPARTGVIRRHNYVKKLTMFFVELGLFSFINALVVAILYCIEYNETSRFLIAAPGVLISKMYVNSMLSVLNARKAMREEQQARDQRSIEIPTIPTIW